MAEIQRFYRANSEYIESLINASENKNKKDSTRNWLKQFEKWAVERKKEVNLEKYAAEELNSTLCEFFAELRKANCDDYEPDSLRVMFSATDRHLKSKSYPKGKTIFFFFAAKFWRERLESYVLKVKGKDLTALKV